jgi:glycosyltransferase involved in cell wall biosynthesis
VRVAQVVPQYNPDSGGVERHVRELARGLTRCGAEVDVLTQHHGVGVTTTHRVDDVGCFRVLGRSRDWAEAMGLGERVMGRVTSSYDVVHAHGFRALLAVAAGGVRPKRLVFSPRLHRWLRSPARHLLQSSYQRVGSTMVAGASAVVCASESEARLLSRSVPAVAGCVWIVPDGIEVGAIERANPLSSSATVVLGLGRLERSQRLDRAVAALVSLDSEFELVLVGEGRAGQLLKALAAELRVEPRVRFAGCVPDGERYRWLKTARVLVALSEHDAFDATLLESICAETPIVASDTPAHREAASYAPVGGARFVPPGASPLALADAIAEAATLEPLGSTLPIPAWEDVAKLMMSVYEAVAADREPALGKRHARVLSPLSAAVAQQPGRSGDQNGSLFR